MNITTNADVKKFLMLVKAGLRHGKQKELVNYTSAAKYDGTDVVKDYYVHLDFYFRIDREDIENLFAEDDFDLSQQVNDLMKDL